MGSIDSISVIFLACTISAFLTVLVLKVVFNSMGYLSKAKFTEWQKNTDGELKKIDVVVKRANDSILTVDQELTLIQGARRDFEQRLKEIEDHGQAIAKDLKDTQEQLAQIRQIGEGLAALSKRLIDLQAPLTNFIATRGGTAKGGSVTVASRELNRQFAELREWHQVKEAGGREGESEADQLCRLFEIMGKFAETAAQNVPPAGG
jgi:predicted  nucleic acid-binding Zn-ribbon protein